jgi:predicted ATPase
MKRYILTGTPGSGKTSLIRFLQNMGNDVVEEAATDVIASEQERGVAEPWKDSSFIDKIVNLQKQRQIKSLPNSAIQFFDRSPICTYALSVYLDIAPSEILLEEIERIRQEKVYQEKVFFIENIGFCEPSAARKISFEESLRFEKIHEEVYLSHGYECVKIASKEIPQRANEILGLIL